VTQVHINYVSTKEHSQKTYYYHLNVSTKSINRIHFLRKNLLLRTISSTFKVASSLLSLKCAPKHTTHPIIFIFTVLRPSCLVDAKPNRPHHLTCGMKTINKSHCSTPVLSGNFGATLSRQESIRLHRRSGSGSQESTK
jgi:hypothetical protein